MTAYINETIFLAPIILIAAYHARRFDKQIPTGPWFHFLWACVFGMIITGLWLIMHKDYLFAVTLVLERFVFFNPLLNLMRHPRKAFFYVHAGKYGSWWDGVLDKVYRPVWVVGAVGLLIIQFFL